MNRFATRRRFVQSAAGASAALAWGGGYRRGYAQDPTAEPTIEPEILGEGGTEITMWVQDFGPSIESYRTAAQKYVEAGNDVKITVQPLAFADLLAKMLPSIAAGNEADIMMGYTDWYVATDLSKLFLNLEGLLGTQAELEQTLFTSTLQTIDMPEGSLYYIPQAAGIRSCVTAYNGVLYGAAGIDANSLGTWEDLVAAGQQLTTYDNGTMTVAGLSPVTAMLSMVKNWIWQVGGNFYDQETGNWSLASDEGEAALQRLVDLIQGDKPTSSYDLVTGDNEFDLWMQGKVATQQNGAWTVGVTPPEQEASAIPTPLLTEHSVDVVYPEHIGVVTLSRRLAKDEAKMAHCVGIAKELISADALIGLTETYSGLLCVKTPYEDPRINDTPFGPLSKKLAESIWPRAQWPRDHVANQAPAGVELDRALRGEITAKEALTNADAYLNDQEQQARERLGM